MINNIENMGKSLWFTVLITVNMNILAEIEYFGGHIWYQDGGHQEALIFGVHFFNDP